MHQRIRALLSRIRRVLALAKPILEWASEAECAIAAAWTKSAHKRLMWVQWRLPPPRTNYDHQIDQFYGWTSTRNPHWLERGVYGAIAIKGGNLLELCCGDGFNARNFYSLKSKQVVACDLDPKIIRVAKRKDSAPNVSFHVADIRTQMPEGQYDNVVWDTAIEYFTETEIQHIMSNIKNRLTPDGILGGHTIAKGGETGQPHEHQFTSKEELLQFLTRFFTNVLVFETEHSGRHNLYFWASDSAIPFGHGWAHASRTEKTPDQGMER
jgi:SAM-dependent methyltransferase